MSRLLAVGLLSLGLASCASTAVRDRGCGSPVSARDYFGKALDEVEAYNLGHMDFYARTFSEMAEPSLACDASGAKSWRLTYERYQKPMVTVRATDDGRKRTLRVIEYRVIDQGSFGWTGRVISNTERPLTIAEWQEIEAAAAASDFWNKPADYSPDMCDKDGEHCRVIVDVPASFVEGRADAYHAVTVWPMGNLPPLDATLTRFAGLVDD